MKITIIKKSNGKATMSICPWLVDDPSGASQK